MGAAFIGYQRLLREPLWHQTLLALGYGETFARSFTDAYPAVDTVVDRARCYAGTFAVQEALWGLEPGRPDLR